MGPMMLAQLAVDGGISAGAIKPTLRNAVAAEPPDSDARRVRSLSTNFGRFAAAASDCEGRSLSARERVDDLPVHPDESMQFALEQAFLIAVRAEASW